MTRSGIQRGSHWCTRFIVEALHPCFCYTRALGVPTSFPGHTWKLNCPMIVSREVCRQNAMFVQSSSLNLILHWLGDGDKRVRPEKYIITSENWVACLIFFLVLFYLLVCLTLNDQTLFFSWIIFSTCTCTWWVSRS